jgi:hypothetical protein
MPFPPAIGAEGLPADRALGDGGLLQHRVVAKAAHDAVLVPHR